MTKKQKQNLYLDIKLLILVTVVAGLIIFGAHIGGVRGEGFNYEKPEAKLSVEEWIMRELEANKVNKYKAWALINCESRFKTDVTLNNGKGFGVDRGIWQISSKYHPEVSNACAFNYKCATKEAIRIIKEKGFNEWACGKNL